MKFEQDEVDAARRRPARPDAGRPVAVRIGNTEWPKWEQVMAPDPVDPDVLAELARNAPLTRPRPGHADLVGMQKYGFDDARPVLERASARETAARVALGAVASAFLRAGVRRRRCSSHVVGAGRGRASRRTSCPARTTWSASTPTRFAASTRRRPAAMVAEVDAAKQRRRHAGRRRRGRGRTGCRRVWAATCTGTAGSTPGWPRRSWASRPSRASRSATGSRPRAAAGSQAHDEIDARPTTASCAARAAPAAPRAA